MVLRAVHGVRRQAVIASIVALGLGACVDEPAPPPTIQIHADTNDTAAIDISGVEINGDDRGDDLCAMAAALPTTDLCSLTCDPDQFAARLISEGMHSGACYHFRCALTPTTTVTVGVCLP